MGSSSISKNSQRLFIAVKPKLHESIFERISQLKKTLPKSVINWVVWENLHLTINFLGDTPVSAMKNLNTAIAVSIKNIKPFTVTFRSFGTFGKPFAKVIWIGIDPCEQLQSIHKSLNAELAKLNFNTVENEFTPHLTIARVKKLIEIKPFENFILKNREIEFHKTTVSSVILFESILKPFGPEYKIISSYVLT